MKTRIYSGRDLIGRFSCDGRKYSKIGYQIMLAKRMAQKCVIASFVVVLGGWLVTAGILVAKSTIEPHMVLAREVVEVPIGIQFEDIPMLVRICKAESGSRQFNKDGSVLRGRVNPSDLGFCQINEYIHNDTARKLGMDIFTEKGNKEYAVYLFLREGSIPWNSSKGAWGR